MALAALPGGELCVADRGAKRVYILDRELQLRRALDGGEGGHGFEALFDMVVGQQGLYLSEDEPPRLCRLQLNSNACACARAAAAAAARRRPRRPRRPQRPQRPRRPRPC